MLEIDATLTYDDVAAMADQLTFAGLPQGITARSSSGIIDPGDSHTFNVAFSDSGNYLPTCLIGEDDFTLADAFVTVS